MNIIKVIIVRNVRDRIFELLKIFMFIQCYNVQISEEMVLMFHRYLFKFTEIKLPTDSIIAEGPAFIIYINIIRGQLFCIWTLLQCVVK